MPGLSLSLSEAITATRNLADRRAANRAVRSLLHIGGGLAMSAESEVFARAVSGVNQVILNQDVLCSSHDVARARLLGDFQGALETLETCILARLEEFGESRCAVTKAIGDSGELEWFAVQFTVTEGEGTPSVRVDTVSSAHCL